MRSRVCANHPDRLGHAVCMACGKVVCRECATEWDGINHCVACLAARRQADRAPSSVIAWIGVVLAIGALLFTSVLAMVWAGSLVAGMA